MAKEEPERAALRLPACQVPGPRSHGARSAEHAAELLGLGICREASPLGRRLTAAPSSLRDGSPPATGHRGLPHRKPLCAYRSVSAIPWRAQPAQVPWVEPQSAEEEKSAAT